LVHPVSEGHVPAGVAPEVQPVRVGEQGRVPVGGFVDHDDPLAGADDLAVDLDVRQRHPPRPAVRDGQVAQQLVHRRGHLGVPRASSTLTLGSAMIARCSP
jgi:hypothetical protein